MQHLDPYQIINCGGFIAPFVYTPDQAPLYIRGHKIGITSICVSWVLTAANMLYCKRENIARKAGRRDNLAHQYYALLVGGRTRAPIGDRDPKFLFTL